MPVRPPVYFKGYATQQPGEETHGEALNEGVFAPKGLGPAWRYEEAFQGPASSGFMHTLSTVGGYKNAQKTHPEWIKDLNVSAHTIELGENPGLTLPELELGSGFLDAQNTNNKGKKKKIHDIIKI